METYDYYARVAEDLRDELPEWFRYNDINGYTSLDDLSWDVRHYFMTSGHVTGYGNGSYTMDPWVAEENLCHNMELFLEAIREYGFSCAEYVESGAEACDALIRCYVLEKVADDIMKEYVAENYPGFGT